MREEQEPIAWMTTKSGKHVPIYSGDSQEDAIKRAFAKETAQRNEDKKASDIAKSKEQADKLNAPQPQRLPRHLALKDIRAEDANKTSDVLHLRTKERYKFVDGTKITKVEVFAGKGCSKEFRDAEKYAKRWGGKAEDWQHCSGNAKITNGSKVLTREVHWVQGRDGKVREAFIKEYTNNLQKHK